MCHSKFLPFFTVVSQNFPFDPDRNRKRNMFCFSQDSKCDFGRDSVLVVIEKNRLNAEIAFHIAAKMRSANSKTFALRLFVVDWLYFESMSGRSFFGWEF